MKSRILSLMCAALSALSAEAASVAKMVSDGLGVSVISNEYGLVVVSLEGARIMSWQDRTGRELLFMPDKKTSDGQDWSHGGISICWPWFGRQAGVIHGFIRTKRFSVRHQTSDSVSLRYSLSVNEEPSFPHAADLDVDIQLKDTLSIIMRTRNTGKETFAYTCGVHPYFAVTDYRGLSFDGVDAKPFACVDGMDKAFSCITDGPFSVTDKVLKQTFSMRADGNSHVIVWTPGTVEPANRNLKPDDMTKFIGFGPAFTKSAGAVVLKPGESHELSLRVSRSNSRDGVLNQSPPYGTVRR